MIGDVVVILVTPVPVERDASPSQSARSRETTAMRRPQKGPGPVRVGLALSARQTSPALVRCPTGSLRRRPVADPLRFPRVPRLLSKQANGPR